MELRGNITTRVRQYTAYADDILLTARTKQPLLDTFQKLKETSAQYGLILNGQKTKYLRCMKIIINQKNYKLTRCTKNKSSPINILDQL
jgi:hypothetical protein